jgi:hypothetical protein
VGHDAAGHLHAVHPRQHEVHRHHVRAQALAQLDGALAIPRLTHHREGGIIGEGIRQAPADHH